ncbi:MAG: helix-turn-helix domain-containing protein [Oscillospiraceae bacterium]|jgi:transcriptional regulator with XRE-family HTH domain|nr:helix-turn-helix domain-containing protein [Oscillospiraceae bacterium]
MNINIGDNIARLRKDKGLTQEALAASVGVSGQAVSKWESGGSPDIELLPVIADFFKVSVDALFGRDKFAYTDIKQEFYNMLKEDKSFTRLTEAAWGINRAILSSNSLYEKTYEGLTLDEFIAKVQKETTEIAPEVWKNRPIHSEIDADDGLVRSRLDTSRRYFLLMPEPEGGWKFDDEKLLGTLTELAEPDFFKALMYVNRNPKDNFTLKYAAEKFGCNETRALELIERLKSYDIIIEENFELDGGKTKIYKPYVNSAILPLLTFVEEMRNVPTFYLGAVHNTTRKWVV